MSRFKDYLQSRQAAVSAIADAAISVGLPVFPCGPTKQPMTSHGFKDASADPDTIRRMFTPTTAMIGVPTGVITGWAVIDIDCKDGARGQDWLDANAHRLPSTRTHATRSGGWHLIFKMPNAELRNSASKIAPGVDVRANGGYVIVPPSPGYHLIPDGPEPAEMPEWLVQAAMPEPKPILPPRPSVTAPRHTLQGGGTAYGITAMERECDAIRTAPDGTKHAMLNKAAYSIGGLVTAGELQQGEAFAQLSAALETILPYCKDKRAAQNTLRTAFQDGMGRPRDIPQQSAPEPDDIHPAAPFIAKLLAKSERKASKPLPVGTDLMAVDGALKLFVDYCEATAFSSQPFLALGAGICALGAVAGRRYRTRTDLRTNFYGIGIADSGGGKDHPRGCVKKMLFAAGLDAYLGGNKIASGSGFLSALGRHPSMLFQLDEFGLWLQNVLGRNAASHQREIWANMMELFTSANLPFGGTEYANQKENARLIIHQPNACIWGTSVPNEFWSALESGALKNGSMARFLVFLSPCNYPDTPLPEVQPVPQALADACKAIAEGATGHDYGGNLGATMAAGVAIEPYVVPETDDARARLLALKAEELAWKRKAEGTYATAQIARWFENAYKLALLSAVSRNPSDPRITAGDVTWGATLARHCIDTLLREAGRFVADSEYEQKINRAMDIIRRFGPVSARDMFLKGWKLPERERTEILRTLIEAGQIQAIEQSTGNKGGRPTLRYNVAITDTKATYETPPDYETYDD